MYWLIKEINRITQNTGTGKLNVSLSERLIVQGQPFLPLISLAIS